MSVRLFFCLSAGIFQKPHVQLSPNFLDMLPMAVARSSSDGNAISYVLKVLWMTSCFHIVEVTGPNKRLCVCFVHFARWRHKSDIRQRCLVEIASWRHRGRSLPSPTTCCFLFLPTAIVTTNKDFHRDTFLTYVG